MADEEIKNEEAPVVPEAVSEVEKLQQELAEAKDKNIRLFAEFENMRKRHERDRAELIKYAHEEVIIEMLGFYEDFERSVVAARANPAEGVLLLKGVEMVLKRMQDLLQKYDVSEIEAAGKKFDHTRHEALLAVESPDVEDGTILEVFQKGYIMDGRVVRTAKVKVSK
ncbi:MAG: nucleotide exchange factor GrpE, partial [Candidatus Omnitrophica bacterium]|nr:nucleotide exchange factor GrpE [Candidatus Omnitrophota bacterium]